MADELPQNQSHETYISTAEAAQRMTVSERTVRELCRRNRLVGAEQERRNGPWRIPLSAVEAWLEANRKGGEESASQPGPPGWWRRFRYRPVVFYSTVAFSVLATIMGLLANLVSTGAELGGIRQQLQEMGLFRAFPAAREGEILIVVARFHYSEDTVESAAEREISRAIRLAAAEAGLSAVRVEVEPGRRRADDRPGAERLGERYNASMVIWGEETPVHLIVNFLNLKQPDFPAAEAQISETTRTQLANPSAYTHFVTQDLPGQLTFFSLFAIGHAHYLNEAYTDSLSVIEKAVASLPKAGEPPDGLADACFRLGWLHQELRNLKNSILNYTRAIQLDPTFAEAYYNRGNARYDQGDLEAAIADYNKAIELDPAYTWSYYNRGNARVDQGDLEAAIADYTKAIELDPAYLWAYYNRGNAHYDQGDLEAAIADYNKAIELDPTYAPAYNNRGNARSDQGDLEAALVDYKQALLLDPTLAPALNNICWIYALENQPETALPYCQRAVEADPSPYFMDSRGLVYTLLGNYPAAISDFQAFVEWTSQQPSVELRALADKRRKWIEALEAGQNPFTPEVLEALKNE